MYMKNIISKFKRKKIVGPLLFTIPLLLGLPFNGVAENLKPNLHLTYKYKYGEGGLSMGRFNSVQGILSLRRQTTGKTLLVLADKGRDLITLYTSDMMFIDKWGGTGSDPGEFNQPTDLALDKAGKLYIVDSKNHRIQKTEVGSSSLVEKPGKLISTFGEHGAKSGQLSNPKGIAVSKDNIIYVTDSGNNRVQSFDTNGKFLFEWGELGNEHGSFRNPTNVHIDNEGNILVADTGNNRIQKFTADGKFVKQIGSVGSGDGQFSEPKGIATDLNNNIWVVDRRNHRIQVFDKNGKFISVQGSQGEASGLFLFPEGISIDDENNLFVTDTRNNRVQVFSIDSNR